MHLKYRCHYHSDFQTLGVAMLRHHGTNTALDLDFFTEEFDSFVSVLDSEAPFDFSVQHPDPTYRYSDSGAIYPWGECWDNYVAYVNSNRDRFRVLNWLGRQTVDVQGKFIELQRRELGFSDLLRVIESPNWRLRVEYLLGDMDDDEYLAMVQKEEGGSELPSGMNVSDFFSVSDVADFPDDQPTRTARYALEAIGGAIGRMDSSVHTRIIDQLVSEGNIPEEPVKQCREDGISDTTTLALVLCNPQDMLTAAITAYISDMRKKSKDVKVNVLGF